MLDTGRRKKARLSRDRGRLSEGQVVEHYSIEVHPFNNFLNANVLPSGVLANIATVCRLGNWARTMLATTLHMRYTRSVLKRHKIVSPPERADSGQIQASRGQKMRKALVKYRPAEAKR